MSSPFSKLYVYETLDLSVLENKVVAIDILPWCYKYLYNVNRKSSKMTILQSASGVVTSHLNGVLNMLINLRKIGVKPIICMDGNNINPLKKLEAVRRVKQRTKKLNSLRSLELNGFSLTEQEQRQKINSSYYVGEPEKRTIIDLCKYLGVPYYHVDCIEGESACAFLKKQGVVDACMSIDRDVLLYGVGFFSDIDFKNRTVKYYDFDQNLDALGLTYEQLFYCVLASGCDYTAGVPKVGPKISIKQSLSNFENFKKVVKTNVPNINQIMTYVKSDLQDGLKKHDPDPVQFVKYLENLNFSEIQILNFISHLFR